MRACSVRTPAAWEQGVLLPGSPPFRARMVMRFQSTRACSPPMFHERPEAVPTGWPHRFRRAVCHCAPRQTWSWTDVARWRQWLGFSLHSPSLPRPVSPYGRHILGRTWAHRTTPRKSEDREEKQSRCPIVLMLDWAEWTPARRWGCPEDLWQLSLRCEGLPHQEKVLIRQEAAGVVLDRSALTARLF